MCKELLKTAEDLWKGAEPECVGHASLKQFLKDDGCGLEKIIKDEATVVDNGTSCKKNASFV